jgi:hypothetical protein
MSFASVADLSARLSKTFTQEQELKVNLILAGATAYIRACTDQWISEVVDDIITIDAPVSDTVWLPQRPVQSVSSVKVDGEVTTGWKLRGSRLVKVSTGEPYWATSCDAHEMEITNTHGHPAGDPGLDLAKDACMTLAVYRLENPMNLLSESVDDYARTFSNGSQNSEWSGLEYALRSQYCRRPKTGSVSTAA